MIISLLFDVALSVRDRLDRSHCNRSEFIPICCNEKKNASSFLAPIHTRTSFMGVRRTAFVKAFSKLFIRWQNAIAGCHRGRNAEITEM